MFDTLAASICNRKWRKHFSPGLLAVIVSPAVGGATPLRKFGMVERKPVFPHVIEMNVQFGERLGCNVYLVYDGPEWLIIDIGFEDAVDDIVDMIRQLDFPLSHCKSIVATHADVDHIQGLAKLKHILKAEVVGHPLAVEPLATGDKIKTFAEIAAQGISMPMPPIKLDRTIDEGDKLHVGNLALEVWHTPGHTDSQLSFRLGDLLLSGDNIYRDGAVGAIDAHHGSDIPSFIKSLKRIRASNCRWLLPSHGPIFRKDDAMLDQAITRLDGYQHMADFGTCAIDWPLLDQWDEELAQGKLPG